MTRRRGYGSPVFAAAIEEWRAIRYGEYDLILETHYRAADEATGGNLLTREARDRGVSSWSLFMGPRERAEKWASEELRAHWLTHPRVTFQEYERTRSSR